MSSHQIISGIGKSFTRKSNKNPYPLVSLEEIRFLVDNPQTVPKDKARWALPSTLHSRNHAEQQNNGSYLYLWADLDKVYQPINAVRDAIESFIKTDYEIYTTHSASIDNQKSRVLIPLAKAIPADEWHQYQGILNKLICELGITPDECNKQYGQFFYLPNRGEFYAHFSRRDESYFNPALEWLSCLNIKLTEMTETTEYTDDDRRVQMKTEITDVIAGVDIDYSNLPSDCTPKAEGERNKKQFNFARYLKRYYPKTDWNQLRPIVMGWHKHFQDVIGTKGFSETWSDFRRGWVKIKVPYGEGIESIINDIDLDVDVPEEFINLGYVKPREFKLLLICEQLQLLHGDEPFFLSCRKAGEFIQYNREGSSLILDSFVADGILEIVKKPTAKDATRYRYIWRDLNDTTM